MPSLLVVFFLHRTTTKDIELFSKLQVLNLRHALLSIQFVGAQGFDHAVVMPDDVVDVLLRCDAVLFRQFVVFYVECYLWKSYIQRFVQKMRYERDAPRCILEW